MDFQVNVSENNRSSGPVLDLAAEIIHINHLKLKNHCVYVYRSTNRGFSKIDVMTVRHPT